MSPEQQRIAIAEACGWKKMNWNEATVYGSPTHGFRVWKSKHQDSIMSYKGRVGERIPDYPNDLNAMHSAILSLTPKQRLVFSDILNSIIPNGFYDDYYDGWVPSGNSLTFSESIFHIATAPTEMLAEAFLKTLNLWKPI